MFFRITISIFFTPILLNKIGQSEFGLYQLVISIVAYLSLLSLGLSSSYVRFYSKFKANDDDIAIAKFNGMFFIIYVVIGIATLLTGAVLVENVHHIFHENLLPSEVQLAKILMIILVINLALSFPATVFNGYIYAHERYFFQKIVEFISILSNPFLSLLVLILGYGSIGLVSITAVLNISIQLAYIIYSIKILKIKLIFKDFNFSLLRELFIFSSFIFINIIVDKINWNVDKFLLGIYQGTTAIAVYSIAAQLNMYYLTFSSAITSVLSPRVNQLVHQEKADEKLNELFIRVSRIQFIIILLMLTGIIFFGNIFIHLWIGEAYSQSYAITLILIIPVTIPILQTLGLEIQRAKNLHRFRAIVFAGIAVLNVIISIPLTKAYGGVGSAMGTAFSLLIGSGLIMNIYYHKKCGINIINFWKEMAKFIPSLILPIATGIGILHYIEITSWLYLFTYIFIYTCIYSLSMWFLAFNAYEKEFVIKAFSKVTQFTHR